jgi:hypothetical protein
MCFDPDHSIQSTKLSMVWKMGLLQSLSMYLNLTERSQYLGFYLKHRNKNCETKSINMYLEHR